MKGRFKGYKIIVYSEKSNEELDEIISDCISKMRVNYGSMAFNSDISKKEIDEMIKGFQNDLSDKK